MSDDHGVQEAHQRLAAAIGGAGNTIRRWAWTHDGSPYAALVLKHFERMASDTLIPPVGDQSGYPNRQTFEEGFEAFNRFFRQYEALGTPDPYIEAALRNLAEAYEEVHRRVNTEHPYDDLGPKPVWYTGSLFAQARLIADRVSRTINRLVSALPEPSNQRYEGSTSKLLSLASALANATANEDRINAIEAAAQLIQIVTTTKARRPDINLFETDEPALLQLISLYQPSLQSDLQYILDTIQPTTDAEPDSTEGRDPVDRVENLEQVSGPYQFEVVNEVLGVADQHHVTEHPAALSDALRRGLILKGERIASSLSETNASRQFIAAIDSVNSFLPNPDEIMILGQEHQAAAAILKGEREALPDRVVEEIDLFLPDLARYISGFTAWRIFCDSASWNGPSYDEDRLVRDSVAAFAELTQDLPNVAPEVIPALERVATLPEPSSNARFIWIRAHVSTAYNYALGALPWIRDAVHKAIQKKVGDYLLMKGFTLLLRAIESFGHQIGSDLIVHAAQYIQHLIK